MASKTPLLYRIIRLYPHELGRTAIIWFIRFLYRFAFVVSWTFVVAQVFSLSHSEISLPMLFLIHALLVFLSSIVSTFLLKRYALEHIFLVSLSVGAVLLLFAQLFMFSVFVKTIILFFVESFILVQLSINIETFTERLFTPVESNRTFPIVESADTVATLAAGASLFFFASSFSVDHVFWLVIGILALLVPLFLQYHSFLRSLPGLCLYRKQLIGETHHHPESTSFTSLKKHPYIKRLILIVLAQWFFMVVLEFLFTYSLSNQILHRAELVPAAAGAVENVLIHEFGLMQIFFGAAALASHFLFAGRIIFGLGIIGSLILHPLVSLFSLATMITSFGPFSTMLSRINAEITGVIFRNAYQSSYYVFEETKSQFVRLMLDGFVRPIGALLGTMFLLISSLLASSQYYITVVLGGVFCALLLFLITAISLHRYYSEHVISQLKSSETSLELKVSLLDVLAQKGHKNALSVLRELYTRPNEPPLILMKLIDIFSREPDFFQDILAALHHEDETVRFAALQALQGMSQKGIFDHQPLSKQLVLTELRSYYLRESKDNLRNMALMFLATFKEKETMEFLFSLLEESYGDTLAMVIQACDTFDDPAFTAYFEKFLESDDSRVWSAAAISLSRHEKYEHQLTLFLPGKFQSIHQSDRRALAFVFTVFCPKKFLPAIERRVVETTDPHEKLLLTFGLLKLGLPHGVTLFLEMLFDADDDISTLAQRLMSTLTGGKKIFLDRLVQHRALTLLHTFLGTHSSQKLDELSGEDLRYLREIYTLLHATEEIIDIDALLHEKNPLYRGDTSYLGNVPLAVSHYV